MALDPAWIALIGTVFGGAGLKTLEHYLGRQTIRVDDASRIRDELRLQDAEQKVEIKELEAAVDRWRTDYYNLRDKYVAIQTELTLALHNIKSIASEAESKGHTGDTTTPLPPSPPHHP